MSSISDPYQEPLNPELRIDTTSHSLEQAAGLILAKLTEQGF
ncbi:MAG TPA: hypothetical protein VNF46_04795 [Gammaproteobacteria bacterium]|nr:hypothetical protein [Gammaproteobacteria bacterium]